MSAVAVSLASAGTTRRIPLASASQTWMTAASPFIVPVSRRPPPSPALARRRLLQRRSGLRHDDLVRGLAHLLAFGLLRQPRRGDRPAAGDPLRPDAAARDHRPLDRAVKELGEQERRRDDRREEDEAGRPRAVARRLVVGVED